jgi:hypothetical protein
MNSSNSVIFLLNPNLNLNKKNIPKIKKDFADCVTLVIHVI